MDVKEPLLSCLQAAAGKVLYVQQFPVSFDKKIRYNCFEDKKQSIRKRGESICEKAKKSIVTCAEKASG